MNIADRIAVVIMGSSDRGVEFWRLAAAHLLRCKIVDRDCSVCERIDGEILAYEYPDSEPIDYPAYGFPVRGHERRLGYEECILHWDTPVWRLPMDVLWHDDRRFRQDRRKKEAQQ